ncbi:MAG TPA: glycoside hydrolase family 13 protein [Chthoniobacteraceae bacterium]|jgi:glycosidase|nr:glycoside hydrolase family 13 protein [Chthoniobacteraceae bacterium]
MPIRRLVFCLPFVALCLARAADAPAPASKAPDWAAHAIWYQIFPERFRNGDPNNDPTRDSLEEPQNVPQNWRISSWTGDWYARAPWETGQDGNNPPDATPNFYKHGVFDRRYGGDLQGVLDKLGYLRGLGVNAIYFNPIFYARSLHKYDGSALHHVDPYFGPDPKGDLALIATENEDPATWHWTAADRLFLKVLAAAHRLGFHVMLDGVFNHTGRDFFAFRDLKEKQQASKYKDWYVVKTWRNPADPNSKFTYKGWWNLDSLPVFAATADKNDIAPGPRQYIWDVTKRWLCPVVDGKPVRGIDGWRLDAADERPAHFWTEWNAYARSLKPDLYTCGETWKPASQFVADDGFSACMNYYAFAFPVKSFLIDDHIPASRFASLLDARREAFQPGSIPVLLNLVDSHDTDRVASMIVNRGLTPDSPDGDFGFNNNNDVRNNTPYSIAKPGATDRAIQRMVVLFQMTYLGAPTVYYGDEAGMWGAHDPDCRMPMVWKDLKFDLQATDPRGRPRHADDPNFEPAIFNFYKAAIALRKAHPVFATGAVRFLSPDDKDQTLAMLRSGTDEDMVVAMNRSSAPHIVHFADPGWSAPRLVLSTRGKLPALTRGPGGWQVRLPAYTAVVCQGAAAPAGKVAAATGAGH